MEEQMKENCLAELRGAARWLTCKEYRQIVKTEYILLQIAAVLCVKGNGKYIIKRLTSSRETDSFTHGVSAEPPYICK
jgi:hypothetical protein